MIFSAPAPAPAPALASPLPTHFRRSTKSYMNKC